MTREEREEHLDWLYRLKNEIFVSMPTEWIIPMVSALNVAIKALEQEPKIVPIAEIKFDDDMLHEIVEDVVKNIEIESQESEDQGSCENVAVTHKSLCDSCATKGCIFQSGIVRNHCDFFKTESEVEK